MAAGTNYSTETRTARNFNDPYGEFLDEMNMAQ